MHSYPALTNFLLKLIDEGKTFMERLPLKTRYTIQEFKFCVLCEERGGAKKSFFFEFFAFQTNKQTTNNKKKMMLHYDK